jgi:hypothetical protein
MTEDVSICATNDGNVCAVFGNTTVFVVFKFPWTVLHLLSKKEPYGDSVHRIGPFTLTLCDISHESFPCDYKAQDPSSSLVALGGVVVSVLATEPKVRGFKRGRGRWILRVIKSVARLPSEEK